ncbi:hypothetical protein F7734_54040 [Scytonema sp. UIC 10036]|uniref:hypothetical protein n=1 Tax=Scytonema sp. UIC 10036 TaxID=2304196 RepID=UPI0012DA8689|nr:hypothetical protein [Scytonema sp. UIC 10036]MUH00725.1 hypothetical protein [Scytonema sp. UIC 10036]
MTTFSIEKDLSIDVPPHILFDALTTSDKIVQYYPLKEVISTWEVGSEIILKGSNGDKNFTDTIFELLTGGFLGDLKPVTMRLTLISL